MKKDVITSQEINYIIRLYKDNYRISEIANILKRSHPGIYGVLVRNNIKIRSRHDEKRKIFFDFDFFQNIDTESKAYFLGLMFSDGTVSRNKNYSVISLQEEDVDILEKFKEYTKFTGDLLYIVREKPRKNMYRITFGSRIFSSHLIRNGCFYKKSLILKFPSHIPRHLIRHFIRGYFDGDGCLGVYNKNIKMSFISSKDFIFGLKSFFESWGFNIGSIGIKNNAKNTYCLQFGGNKSCKKILDFMYKDATICLNRKKEKMETILKEINN